MAIKVGINGFGTIGKRVAAAVSAQDDMEVVGVTKTRPTFEAEVALNSGYRLFAVQDKHVEGFRNAGIEVSGTLEDLLDEVDIIVDCSPGKLGASNAELYAKHGVKAIWQGGEKHDLAGVSFNALANYNEALGKDRVRVVSCNTTGLCRTLYPITEGPGIDVVYATMIRRATDPGDSKKGPINAIEPVLKVPSHHGPDVQTVIHDLNINTMAVKVPTTIMHVHAVTVKLNKTVEAEDILSLWRKTPRVKLISGAKGLKSTAEIMELARDLGRNLSDMYEIVVWEDGTHVNGDTLYYYQAIHQESDVVPENVDAIRAMFEMETDNMKSIEKTNKAMNIM